MTINAIKNYTIATLVIVLFLSVYQCTSNKKLSTSQAIALIDTTNQYKNEIGTITATKKVLQIEKKDLKELVYSKNDTLNTLRKEFSKVKAIVKIKTVTIIDSIPVPFEVRVPCDFERSGKHLDKWLQFDYAVNQNGFNISDFTMKNKQTTITGFKRKWFLGKQTYTTDVTNTNPHIKITEVQTIEVVVPKRFYDTRLFNIGVGFLGGILIMK